MNSTHDLGGMHGFGPIDRSQEALFPNEWEQKVFGMTLACGMLGQWNLDESRFAREQMDPGEYLTSSYYEHWLHGLEKLLVDKGIVTSKEIESGHAQETSDLNAVTADRVPDILGTGGPTLMDCESSPGFAPGDEVRVKNFNPRSHTRAPRYIRGRKGVVSAYYGAHIFPDQHSASGKKIPAHLYCIRFESNEIWGDECGNEHRSQSRNGDKPDKSAVYVDVFEPYLEQ